MREHDRGSVGGTVKFDVKFGAVWLFDHLLGCGLGRQPRVWLGTALLGAGQAENCANDHASPKRDDD